MGDPPGSRAAAALAAALALLAGLIVASSASAQTGTGTVAIEPPSHAFGEVEVGTESDVAVFLVTNTGEQQITVEAVSLKGSDPDQFTIVEDLCVEPLQSSRDMCEVWVGFAPTSSGEKGAVLEVATTGGAGSSVLTGTGRQFLEPPPTEGDLPRYDLSLRHFLLSPWGMGVIGITGPPPFAEWQGELALPLVMTRRGVAVGRVPILSRFGLDTDLARSILADVIVGSDPRSERESLPATLEFATAAPLRLTALSLMRITGAPSLTEAGECRLVADGPPIDPDPGFDDVTVRGRCEVDPIPPGDVRFAQAGWEWERLAGPGFDAAREVHGSRFPYMWELECKPPTEWDCSAENHTVLGSFLLAFPPNVFGITVSPNARIAWGRARGPRMGPPARDRAQRRLDAAGRASGAPARGAGSARRRPPRRVMPADRPARVDVALVRLAKGQRGLRGAPVAAPPDLGQAEGDGKRRCLWLANRKRKFKQVPAAGRVCDKPVWLRAKLRNPKQRAKPSRWRFRLAKRLRPGRYVLYTRATTRRGMPEMVFNRKRGNRVQFRVTKRGKVRRGRGHAR